jgi:hypothetical protein
MEKNKGGRPKKEIDFDMVDNLLGIMCTGEEVADILGVDYDTLNARIKEQFKVGFSDYIREKQSKGKASLRRRQYLTAVEEGNPTMLIWLGKQYLGQKDKQETEMTVQGGEEPIKVTWQK